MTREFEVTIPEDHWLTLTEIGGEGHVVRAPCSNTADIDAVEGALLAANFRPQWENDPVRLTALLG
ncbi:hypothetical protein BKG79_22435 [Mycobacteroides chelonae]|uniref:hypothetical protein n=1 Tax=Mycobacteriaceae TaxID=1762 RepID=UPI0008A9D6AC|nr:MULTISPECIES: hypothetical protein [Mycobacteriaceae]OHU33363.1 hypothetical protein BKG79_22435 [Mycobacteroides chelonae]